MKNPLPLLETYPIGRLSGWLMFAWVAVFSPFTATHAEAAILYVNPKNLSPAAPYGTWETAAKTIQQAVDASFAGDEVVVTNGVYASGSLAVDGGLLNRVVVAKPLLLRSVNGPEVTIIRGIGSFPFNARCLYLSNGPTISGFTLTNGSGSQVIGASELNTSGGGAFCASSDCVLTNCLIVGNAALTGAGVSGGMLQDCVLTKNSAPDGAILFNSTAFGSTVISNTARSAVSGCRLYGCSLLANTGAIGEGAASSTLESCTIRLHAGVGARASQLLNCLVDQNAGGGAADSILKGCTITDNTNAVYYGAGAGLLNCTATDCRITRNFAGGPGGGAAGSTLTNCVLVGNSTANFGGGLWGGRAYNCTITGNSASLRIGGAYEGQLHNCIVYHNEGVNCSCTADYTCTTPLAPGPGNIDVDPLLMTESHLSLASPCVGAGSSSYVGATDIDGDSWRNPPAMGADQPQATGQRGDIGLLIRARSSRVAVGTGVELMADSTAPVSQLVWEFADGTTSTNTGFVTHSWDAPGTRTVRVTAYNESHPEGVSRSVDVEVIRAEYYVNATSSNPTSPFTSWETAARTIQAAVNASDIPGRIIWVTNGVYNIGTSKANGPGGEDDNRVVLTNSVIVKSLNGPAATIIHGNPGPGGIRDPRGVRCVYMRNGSELHGFTVSGGFGYGAGGILGGGMVRNCLVSGNMTGISGDSPMKVFNSIIKENLEDGTGGGAGAQNADLYQCTIVRNGVYGTRVCSLYNCISYFNAASYVSGPANSIDNRIVTYTCTTPMVEGAGNISVDPQFLTETHLLPSSPCVAAGNPIHSSGQDIDGESWLTPPCMGADQFHPEGSFGDLQVFLSASEYSVVPGYAVRFYVDNLGAISKSIIDFGDGQTLTNASLVNHAWTSPGAYSVTLTGFNDSHPDGQTAQRTISVVEVNHFVNFASTAPQFPYTNWQTAARTIQEAVDASNVPDRIVWVTNGIYNVGSKGSFETEGQNRVVLTNKVHLRSVNGPEWTLIRGERTADVGIRGVYLVEGSVLEGFTIEGGSAGSYPASGVRCKGNGQILNCIIRNIFGAGANGGRYYNCWFTGNSGEGVVDAALYNCTVTHNRGVGVRGCQVFNGIVYYNTGGNAWNHDQTASTFAYSCTTPLAPGLGNISSSPKLASFLRLTPESPCIGAGNSTYSVGEDLDGQAWLNPPCMGADQLIDISHEGDIQLGIVADGTNVGVGFPLRLSANIDGDVQSSVWDFGDGVRITNNPALTHAWSSPGVYPVRLIGYNATFPQGIETTTNIAVISQTFYVNPGNLSPLAPYESWATAATNIQDAINAGTIPGRVIVVTNGTYATGQSSISVVVGDNQVNRIAITNGAVLKSVNGPAVTVIDGTGMRCVYLGGGAQISGFTLTKGSSIWGGAGVASDGLGIVTNCIITNNIFPNDGRFGGAGALNTVIYNSWLVENFSAFLPGGGAMGSELINCIVSGNKASEGGGVAECLIRNCTVTKNRVPAIGTTFAFPTGGGASKSTIDNCIVEFNRIAGFGDQSTSNHVACFINYSCTGPLPASGHGNFSADPRFVSAADNNFLLAPNSPCINSGLNSLAPTSTDLAGAPRIIGGAVDVGAYEYLTPKSILSYAWLQKYGLPIDGSADFKDSDADGVSNVVEWEAGTSPKDSQSKLKLLPLTLGNSGALVTWKSVSERNYAVQRARVLSSTQTFETISPTLPGQTNITSYLDPTPIGEGSFYYRVKVLNNE